MLVFDLIDRMKEAPIDLLAETLRGIHELRAVRPATAFDAATSALAPAHEAEPRALRAPIRRGGEDAALASVVAALKRVHERRQAVQRNERSGGLPPEQPASGYDRVRRHFHEHEERLRRHAFVTGRILDGLRGTGVTASVREGGALVQQELHLLCPVGAGTGGRFVAANESGRSLELELRPGKVRGVPAGWGRHVPVRCAPARFILEAGAQRTVHLHVDLRDCPLQQGDRLGLTVDAVGEGQLLQKVWVEIEMVSPAAAVAAEEAS